jgi:hypothetical protein
MRVDTRPRRQNAPRPAEKSAPSFLQWLRGRPCYCGGQCAGRIEAAHVDYAGDKGIGTKVSDRFAVPLCAAHHAEQHQSGIRTFEARHSLNMLEASKAYWSAWPGRRAWEEKNKVTISVRVNS